jgi:pimeloyl-ACP methyl ester carboxylesterase
MFRTQRRAGRPAVRALLLGGRVLLSGTVLALALGSCTFPSSGSGGSDTEATAPPAASTPPAGIRDPASDPAFGRFYQQRVQWSSCGDGFQCSRVTVPLDWTKPARESIELSVIRLPAEGKKLGSLLINPGGPGASGITYAKAARQVFGRSILRDYDVVGFDPRGIGQSDPVRCLPDSQLDAYVAADATPDTPAEVASSVADVRRYARACVDNSGPLLRHVDTISTVRDLDVLRAVVGDDVLTYHGASYGTYIGAWYAQLFPWRVGRMVLDGAIDPSISSAQYVAGQAEGFSRALRAFVKDCLSQGDCPLRGSVDQGVAQVGTLVARADSSPLRTQDPRRPLTQSLMVTGIAQGLYDNQLWPALTIGLTSALSGNGETLLRLADAYTERDAKGHYGQTISANPAIFCLDVPETRTPHQIAVDAAELEKRYPPLGDSIGWGALNCSQWPYTAVVPRQKLTAVGAAPILVLGTVDDPATPYEWAKSLATQLSSGRLLTWQGSVHTAYHQGSDCIDGKVEAYYSSGTLPPVGTTCPAV